MGKLNVQKGSGAIITFDFDQDVILNLNKELVTTDKIQSSVLCGTGQCYNCNNVHCIEVRCSDKQCTQVKCSDVKCSDKQCIQVKCTQVKCTETKCSDCTYDSNYTTVYSQDNTDKD